METALADLERRLAETGMRLTARVDRAERTARRGWFLAVALAAGGLLFGFARPAVTQASVGSIVKAPFRVVDEKGQPLFILDQRLSQVGGGPLGTDLRVFHEGKAWTQMRAQADGGAVTLSNPDATFTTVVLQARKAVGGSLQIGNGEGLPSLRLRGWKEGGDMAAFDDQGKIRVTVGADAHGGRVGLRNPDGRDVGGFLTSNSGGGFLSILDKAGTRIVASLGNDPSRAGGLLQIMNGDAAVVASLGGAPAGGGSLAILDGNRRLAATLASRPDLPIEHGAGGVLTVYNDRSKAVGILGAVFGGGGRLDVRDENEGSAIFMSADNATGGNLLVRGRAGRSGAGIRVLGGSVSVNSLSGAARATLDETGPGGGGQCNVWGGSVKVHDHDNAVLAEVGSTSTRDAGGLALFSREGKRLAFLGRSRLNAAGHLELSNLQQKVAVVLTAEHGGGGLSIGDGTGNWVGEFFARPDGGGNLNLYHPGAKQRAAELFAQDGRGRLQIFDAAGKLIGLHAPP